MWNWSRIEATWNTTWGTYRHAAALKGLLNTVGFWKFVILGGSVIAAVAGTVFARLSPILAVLACLLGIALLLSISGLAVVLYRVNGSRNQTVEEIELDRGKLRSTLWFTAVTIVLALGVVGWLANRNKPSTEVKAGHADKKSIPEPPSPASPPAETASTTSSEKPVSVSGPKTSKPKERAQTAPVRGHKEIAATIDPESSAQRTPAQSSQSGTAVGSVTVQPGGAASFGQQGGTTIGQLIVNPPTQLLISGVSYDPEVTVPTAFVNRSIVDAGQKSPNVVYIALRLSELSTYNHLDARIAQARMALSTDSTFVFFDANPFGYALKTPGHLSSIGPLDSSDRPGVYYLRPELKDTANALQKLLEFMDVKVSGYRHLENEEEIEKHNLPGKTQAIDRYKFWTASGIDIEICL